MAQDGGAPHLPKILVDRYGRTINYLRVSVTDRCNLGCLYCRPVRRTRNAAPKDILSFEEIAGIAGIARSEFSFSNIRLTGGEPLARNNIELLVSALDKIGFNIGMTTNGAALATSAKSLRTAGLDKLNISLDTLDAAEYNKITGGDINAVFDGIAAAQDAGFEDIKINVVYGAGTLECENAQGADGKSARISRGTSAIGLPSDKDERYFLMWAAKRGLTVKFIERMPVGNRAFETWPGFAEFEKSVTGSFGLVPSANPGFGPGRYYGNADFRVGFIAAVSKPFCERCNRLRLTSDGKLIPCLGHPDSVDIKKILRSGSDAKIVRERICGALVEVAAMKPENHGDFARAGELSMTATGG